MLALPAIWFTISDTRQMIRNGDSVLRASLARAEPWSAGKVRGNEERAYITLPTPYPYYA